MRGPNCYREANPRRLLFDSRRDRCTKQIQRRGVATRLKSGPRIAMRGSLRLARLGTGREYQHNAEPQHKEMRDLAIIAKRILAVYAASHP